MKITGSISCAFQVQSVLKNMKNDGRTARAISGHMTNGDIVSSSDEKNLMEYDPMLYLSAKMSQRLAPKHRDLTDRSLADEYGEKAREKRDERRELIRKLGKSTSEPCFFGEDYFEEEIKAEAGALIDVRA